MSRPTCSSDCTLYNNTCYCRCPTGTSAANEDPTKCIADSPTCAVYAVNAGAPGSLIDDQTFTMTCIKVRQDLEDGLCAPGFTEWQSGSCYINCPSGLIENGLSCLKRPLQRSYKTPECDNGFFYLNGSDCVISLNSIFFALVIAVLFYFVYVQLFSSDIHK